MDDVTLNTLKVQTAFRLERDGAATPLKRAQFWLGAHGPFIEDLPADDTWQAELARRVDALQRSLRSLTT